MSDLNKNEEIDGSDDMGGFTLPPEGNITKGTGVKMEFTGEIKSCVSKESKKGLLFDLVYYDDPSARARVYCSIDSQPGLAKIVGIGRESGVFNKIDKKRIAQNKTPIQSSDGKVKVKILTDLKFHEQLRKEIAGCTIICTINHTEAKPYVDKETGETKEGFPQANISKIAADIGKTSKKSTGPGKADKLENIDQVEDETEWEQ